MSSHLRRTLLLVVAMVLMIAGNGLSASAATTGTLKITITTPSGVPATVWSTLSGTVGPTRVFSKGATSISASPSATVPTGSYLIQPKDVLVNGLRYFGTPNVKQATVTAGTTTGVAVAYEQSKGPQSPRLVSVSSTRATLTWTMQITTGSVVRRSIGTSPPTNKNSGVGVIVQNGQALDSGLRAGTTYSYAIFPAAPPTPWDASPATITINTPGASGSVSTYALNPAVTVLQATQVSAFTPGTTNAKVTGSAAAVIPRVGSIVVVPVIPSAPGGFLGRVTAISTNGRMATLERVGLGDAFDVLSIKVPDLGALATAPYFPTRTNTEKSAVECKNVTGIEVAFSPSVKAAGHFNYTINKTSILGIDIPQGVELDTSYAATVSGPLSVKASGGLECGVGIPSLVKTFMAGPVPITAKFDLGADVGWTGAVEVSNIGMAATAGFQAKARFSLSGDKSATATPILTATPLVPKTTLSTSVKFKVGGQLEIGPGVGISAAGALAGIGGDLYPIDGAATASVSTPQDGNVCLKLEAAFTRSLYLTAKAWAPGHDWSAKLTAAALQGSTSYGDSPWYYPKGCSLTVDPGADVVGPGVTLVGDNVTGSADQWGHVDGFAPGKTTWVLSTGRMSNATGTPDIFASTDLGGVGDSALTTYAGYPTNDAASYEATVIPAGTKLNIQYVFASEEYPEYVGSHFNDVMAVFVNGSNCAVVPGTSTPVAVNTVNASTNSNYYVDNSLGASGYGTSMDGLTKPLTCSVPVTPGKPVTVKIAVADASDGIYDSAVALLDKGIWSS